MSIARQWVRLYTSVLDDPKIQRLPDSLFRFWIDCILLCGLRGGYLPSTCDCAFRMRISERQVIAKLLALEQARLVERTPDGLMMHDWQEHQYDSDSSTSRVKRFRERFGNVSETPQNRTEQIQKQNRTEQSAPDVLKQPRGYALDEQFAQFRSAYREWSPDTIEEDFLNGAWHEWRLLDAEQRAACIEGVRMARHNRDAAMAPRPKNWIKNREWTRPPRPEKLTAHEKLRRQI
jgi:hypothetical protein